MHSTGAVCEIHGDLGARDLGAGNIEDAERKAALLAGLKGTAGR